jgi:hypothetical protein
MNCDCPCWECRKGIGHCLDCDEIDPTLDLGNDQDGDLDGYDGGYGPVGCICPPSWNPNPHISCPAHCS